MKPLARPVLDNRQARQILAEILQRRPGYTPDWEPPERGLEAALLWVFARYQETVLQRLNQAPDKNKLAFLDLMGLDLIPAQAARAPMVVQLAEDAADSRLPAGSQFAAPPPPEGSDQIIFETERSVGLAAGRLTQVVSLWPGRDQYIDHSPDLADGQPFRPFNMAELQDTPHTIYIAHDTLLALAGEVKLDVEFELTQASNERLDITWEYWDGEVWRGFRAMHPECEGEGEEKLDGTGGLTRSGRYRLETDCAESAKTSVNGIEAFWIRGRLTEPLPPDPEQVLPEVESIKLRMAAAEPAVITRLEEHSVTFDSLVPGTEYGGSAGHVSGDLIFSEDGIQVSVHDFQFTNTGSTFNSCQVSEASSGFGTGNVMDVNNINLRFDFTFLGGVAQQVRFEFLDQGGHENIAVNGQPIFAGELSEAPVSIAPGVTLKVSPLGSIGGRAGAEAILTGTIESLLVGGQEFLLDNISAQVAITDCPVPDLAFADATPLDLSTAFYPLGQQPRPGSVLYFTSEDLFGKPGAQARVFITTAPTPEQSLDVRPGREAETSIEPLIPEVVWEYWNGAKWIAFVPHPVTDPAKRPDFQHSGEFIFDIPKDMALLEVNGEEARWMRARLRSGGYGFKATVAWSDSTSETANSFTYVVPQPPALAGFRHCYTWQYGPLHPEHVLTYNDFQYQDQTEAAKWPGNPFQPFQPVNDDTPALYLGFDKQLPVDRMNLFFDIPERRGETQGPALLWEYWDGFNWRELGVEDETQHLRVPGMVSFIAAQDSRALARFGPSLHWLRARLKEDGPPGDPTLNSIFTNAVWVSQQQTLTDDPLGASTGQANQVFTFRQIPVLAGEEIQVRELAGARANVEWRILAMELFDGDTGLLRDLEERLGTEGPQTDVEEGPLRLRRDRNKRVTEAWVRWEGRRHLLRSGPNDRHYLLERARGRLYFGDGQTGKIPPPGAAILARRYLNGGGLAGNIAAQGISQILATVGGVDSAFNPKPAEGGANGESLEKLILRGPRSLRHRGRALTPGDYETMAKEASPAVAVARAIPTRDPAGLTRPGWVTLLIVPYGQEPRPWPSFGLRERVRKYLEARTGGDLAALHQIHVTGPEYLAVDVETSVIPRDPSQAGAVEQRVRQALETFFHPLRGGPEGRGWELGRDVFLSDVASALERVEGVDYAEALDLLLDGVPQRERVKIAADRIVVAGEIRIKMKLD